MTSLHRRLRRSSDLLNNLTRLCCRFNHTLADVIEIDDRAKVIATQISNCTSIQQLNQIYAHIIRTDFLELFPAQFYYNIIGRSYSYLGLPRKAVHVYITMLRAGLAPDAFALPIVLKAACQDHDRSMGKQLHGSAIKYGFELNMYCESGFISLYAKAGEFSNAVKVFEENTERKLGSWNAIIAGFSQGGRARDAVRMFIEMMKSGFEPDDVTMVSVTSACGNLGDLTLALQLHKYVFQANSRGRSNILMMNSLIDMYGKGGRMDFAHTVFCGMETKNVSSWTAMIVGYSTNGQFKDALSCFDLMIREGVKPNHVTFVGVLSACVHGGMVREGKYYFGTMKCDYGITPMLPHYGCMVDLLGRAGLFEEAKEMIEAMPMKANVVIWGCLMGACEKYGNVRMAEWVAEHMIALEPWNDGVYVVLSNIYASHSMWKDVHRMREIMKKIRIEKLPAYSLTENSN